MTETREYIFKIKDFTPETMPFGRLVEYYSEIKKLLGMANNLHLIGISESSHGSTLKIDAGVEADLINRLRAINERTAPKAAIIAFDTVNSMLKDDRTSATFSDASKENVIQFPGRPREDDSVCVINDSASFTGELYHIAGASDGVKIRLSTDSHGVVFCKTSKEIGKALRDFLFDNVRIIGKGNWSRTSDGKWDISDFVITDYSPVAVDGLRDAVDRIRSKDIDWPEDPIAVINENEERNQQIH
jgi:hypothetical protein